MQKNEIFETYDQQQEKKGIEKAAEELADKYTKSPYHTNAGRWIRFVVRFLPLDTILKAVQAKVKNKIP